MSRFLLAYSISNTCMYSLFFSMSVSLCTYHCVCIRYQRKLMLRLLGRLDNAMLNKGWGTWRSADTAKQRYNDVIRLVGGRWRSRATAASFNSWASYAEECIRNRIALKRAAAKMLNRSKAAAFDAWAEKAEEAKAQRILLARAAAKMLNRTKAASWGRWLEMVDERQHMRELVKRVLGRLVNSKVVAGFGKWRETLEEYVKEMRRGTIRGDLLDA